MPNERGLQHGDGFVDCSVIVGVGASGTGGKPCWAKSGIASQRIRIVRELHCGSSKRLEAIEAGGHRGTKTMRDFDHFSLPRR